MTSPQFSRAAGDDRLYWLDGASWGEAGGFGLVLFATSTDAPPTLDLPASFTGYPGYYVSLARRPSAAAEPAFVDAVRALGEQLGPARFLWLDSAVPGPDWSRRVVYLDQPAGAPSGTVQRPTVFDFGRYRFSVTAGQRVQPSGAGFTFDPSGLPGLPGFQLLTDDKAWPLTSDGADTLSASGPTAGAFQVSLSIDATPNRGGVGDYELLDVGFRFGLPNPVDELLLDSLRYPLFKGVADPPVPMTMSFDPVGVLNPARTMLRYPSTPAAMTSHYSSQLGFEVTIAADAGNPATPAGLAFHRSPRSVTEIAVDDPLYLAPVGPYTLAVGAGSGTASPAARLTGGVSGSEYFGFSTGAGVPITFTPTQSAFAPDFPPVPGREGNRRPAASVAGQSAEPDQLTGLATTSYASLGPPAEGQAWYFAQPDSGAFFAVRAAGSGEPTAAGLAPYLELLELVSGDVTGAATGYPLVPYAGADGNLGLMQALESQILSPLRRAALDAPATGPRLAASGALPTQATTPQGLLAGFDGSNWATLTLSPAAPGTALPRLAFNSPSAKFQSALQSNQLFLVAANPAELQENSDFNYWITDAVLGDLARLSGPEAVPASVITLLSQQARAPQTSSAAFTAMLDRVLTGPNAQYRATVIKYSMYFELAVEDWRFRMSPSLWRDQRSHPPVLIVKYADGSLYDFVQNTSAWAWPAVATPRDGSIADTQALLNGILDSALAEFASLGSASTLAGFVTDIVLNPSWTGVLMLNANVPFSSVPPELAGLAAGIEADQFRAHHVGISVTPVNLDEPGRKLAQDPSSVFGLIDYSQLADIAHIEGEFDFKVLLLQVLFANSAVANFAGRIELFVNRLFGELVTLYNSAHYNNLILNGSYQRQGGAGHYVFATGDVSLFGASGAGRGGSSEQVVLLSTEIDQAQFVTASRDTAGDSIVRNRFLLQGKLRFAGLAGFDAFSFGPTMDRNGVQVADGYLSFNAASIDMDVPINAPDERVFRFNLDEIFFDPAASQARPTSFFQRFPLQVAGLVQGAAGQPPRELGYLPLATPLSQPGLSGPWFGLLFAIDLGTLGALSSTPGLTALLLAAWSPAGSQHQVNIGLKLPGVESARSLLPIEGVLDLGFSAVELSAAGATASPPDPAYVLRFRNFYLRFLGWKFPPGQNSIALFGNPEAASQSIATDRGALGWYAAY
ncbi:MAG: hypothetical protein QOE23_3009, partial [Pseudonocardiales bacterium]|nr:hypothetical protein [Pseudonocardiales bacterium]